ncbi:ferrous iron transport protein B [Lachnospiraceae bacterium]|jgi:ferrous iron transport protein B|nr:ferrous iron transport protein B [uncultured Schaedlerella sp.]MCI9155112.1 ferrous iron transport protein B [Ruminococcus sp.]NBI56922.1 ferrous iron transport protein B [Lachnospiraceae bacterium]
MQGSGEVNRNVIRAGFIGNPNCGKTTLFNACTGASLKVANWPGVTVEKKEGWTTWRGMEFHLTDLPGVYSLASYTMEEHVSKEFILSGEVDVVVDVADASSLERNLYLTLQLLELGKPVVLALNMMDIVRKRGMEIDLPRLSELLGIPCIAISARERMGLDLLLYAMSRYEEYEKPVLRAKRNSVLLQTRDRADYDLIEEMISQVVRRREKTPMPEPGQMIEKKAGKQQDLTDRIDRYLTGKWLGLPIFLAIMAMIFLLTFTVGGWLKGYFEMMLELLSEEAGILLDTWKVSPMLRSLIVEGIISGVGGILTFLPNIFILFLALACLEDSGYMARAAFVMDDLMSRVGLSGKAFLPLLLGFGCSVPAIMASRTLEHRKDRLKTILITPFMSCSARLPVYVLFSGMFFGKYAMAACFSMYLIGILAAVVSARILFRLDHHGTDHMLLIELPKYQFPDAGSIMMYVWEKVKDYLTKAGTVIFLASVVMWFLLNFGAEGYVTDMSRSFGAVIGKCITPVFEPAGLGYWQIIVALISGIAAKEVVVSSCSLLFGIANITTGSGMEGFAHVLEEMGFGMPNAYALMTFCLLYVPCTAAIAAIRKETESGKITAAIVLFQTAAAWVVSVISYQVLSLCSDIFVH